MKKILICTIVYTMVLASGCMESDPTKSPTETVYEFTSSFESGKYDTCYHMMTNSYQEDYSLKSFVDNCKKSEKNGYQLIAVDTEYIDKNIAIVDVKYNVTAEYLILSKLSLRNIETETVTETKDGEIELVSENGGWKFKKFPEIIV